MAERITVQKLERVVDLINKETGDTADYRIDPAYGGYRLESHGGSRDVSPRMNKTELYYRLHAFRQGIEVGKATGRL